MSWELRRATLHDLDAILALERSTFADDAWSAESMRAELSSPHDYYLVADRPETPGEVDGYAGLLAPQGAGQGDIQTIAVAEPARRHGLGRALLRALLQEAAIRSVADVFLEVRSDNPGARALYASEGFEAIGERPDYYPGGVAAIVMRKASDA